MSEACIAETERTTENENWKPVLLKMLAGVLALVLVVEVAFYLVVVPTTSQIRLSVEGAPSVGYDEFCSLAGLSGNERWIGFNTADTAARLAANPLFESVLVEKRFPDRVLIKVVERTAVAVAIGSVNGRTIPLEIDRTGVVFRIGGSPDLSSHPLLTGLTFENPVAGMRLHSQLKPLLMDLYNLEKRNSVLLSSVSEIKVEEKTYGGYDLVVYPVHTPVRVRTDKALNEDALQYMMLVLDVVKNMNLDISEIDIRAGTVAYRVKGDLL